MRVSRGNLLGILGQSRPGKRCIGLSLGQLHSDDNSEADEDVKNHQPLEQCQVDRKESIERNVHDGLTRG